MWNYGKMHIYVVKRMLATLPYSNLNWQLLCTYTFMIVQVMIHRNIVNTCRSSSINSLYHTMIAW